MAAVLKTVIGASRSGVQIPPPPPNSYSKSPLSRIVLTDFLGPLTGDLTGIFSTSLHRHGAWTPLDATHDDPGGPARRDLVSLA